MLASELEVSRKPGSWVHAPGGLRQPQDDPPLLTLSSRGAVLGDAIVGAAVSGDIPWQWPMPQLSGVMELSCWIQFAATGDRADVPQIVALVSGKKPSLGDPEWVVATTVACWLRAARSPAEVMTLVEALAEHVPAAYAAALLSAMHFACSHLDLLAPTLEFIGLLAESTSGVLTLPKDVALSRRVAVGGPKGLRLGDLFDAFDACLQALPAAARLPRADRCQAASKQLRMLREGTNQS